MKVTFYGATGTVTGSKYLVETNDSKLLIDCGLFQGYKNLRQRNWKPFPFDPKSIDAVLLTHAHLDHSGMIPLLYKEGFRGPVYSTYATYELCKLLLPDSGHLQEEEAKFRNKHGLTKHKVAEPLYDLKTAQESLSLIKPLAFEQLLTINDANIKFNPAGHILGAATIRVESENKSIVFTGDLGRPNDLVMYPAKILTPSDYLVIESTYGNRLHDKHDPETTIENIVNQTVGRGGSVLIPSFAVGRSQSIMFVLSQLMKAKRIPSVPIYLDSPMAINASDIYCDFSIEHRLNTNECNQMCDHVTYTRSVDESKAIANSNFPKIIISASGMATGGRVLHHLKRMVSDYRNSVVFAGYQAGGTRGQKLLQGKSSIRIFGEEIEVKASISKIPGFSAHADYSEMIDLLKQSTGFQPKKVFVVHGEVDAADEFRIHLEDEFNWNVCIPEYKDSFDLI